MALGLFLADPRSEDATNVGFARGVYEAHVKDVGGSSVQSETAPLTVTTADRRQGGPSSRHTPLTISEIMYHPGPASGSNNLQYIELFNTEPVAHDLSGWHICGDADYVFPAGTALGGRSYLVVAGDPAAARSYYGISNVVGPLSTNLPNDRGTVRLRDRLGAKLLEVEYRDEFPWPVSADGAGHSLQLSRPDYGEGSAQACSASSFIGGSPGRADVPNSSPLRDVVINEVLYGTDLPQVDFVELFNRGTQAVDISGCILSDTYLTNKFHIPPGTWLSPGGFTVFGQETLGFNLKGQGDQVFLLSADGQFVMDAVRFGGGTTGVSIGRFPDGASWSHELSATTPGTNNAALPVREVVINEIMYHPISGDDRDGYVELYNRSTGAVEVSQWEFTDGISFVFPAGTVIPPQGYLVVAKDAARLRTRYPNLDQQNTLGNFGGSLSDRGERLALSRPRNPGSADQGLVLVDEVIYGDGEDWGRWADGGGSSLELMDPASDNRLAMNWRDSDESRKSTSLWTNISTTQILQNGNGPADELNVFLMGAGECLVDEIVVRKIGAARLLNESFESGAAGWQFWGNHMRSSLETGEGFQSARSLHLRASGAGDMTGGNSKGEEPLPTYNRVTKPLGASLAAGDTVTIECRARWLRGCPVLVLGFKGLWMEASGVLPTPTNLGTPGARNSQRVENAGPALWEVAHSPVLPRAAESVVVSCRAHDPDSISALTLAYRVDPSSTVQVVTMHDDGLNGDALAGDGIYAASLPGQPAGTLLAFTISATDALGASTRFPQTGPEGAPVRECLIRFGETEFGGSLGTYRMWMTASNVEAWNARPARSDEPLDLTFVSGSERVIYNASARYRGNWRVYNGPAGSSRCSYAIDFHASDRFLGDNEVKLDMPGQNGADIAIQRERHSSWFASAMGLPASNLRFVRAFFNGSDRGVNGLLADKDIPGRKFIESVYGDGDPQCFENTRFHNDQTVFSPLAIVRNPDGAFQKDYYRWYVTRGATDVPSDDYEPLYQILDVLNTTNTALYTLKCETLIDVDNWMGVFALNHIIGNGDTISWRNSKNTSIYIPSPSAGNPKGAKTFVIDTDQCFGIGSNPGTTEPLLTCNDAVIARMMNNPQFLRSFWRYAEEAVNGPMAASRNDPEVDAWCDALIAEGASPNLDSTTTIKTYISGRRAFLVSQLSAVNPPFRITLNGGGDFTTNRNLVQLSGTAPVAVAAVAVNGATQRLAWDSVNNWHLHLVLAPGENTFQVAGLDRNGNPISGAETTIHITYAGPVARVEDCLAISEILYNPTIPGTAFVEINNSSADTAFDLSGYKLQGVDFDFPPGTVIAPGQALAVAENRIALGQAYGWSANVVGEYAGRLQFGGETLNLLRRGTLTNQIIDQVRYENVLPWSTAAARGGVSLQAIDLSQDNSRVSNWSEGSDWRFFSVTALAGTTPTLLYFWLDRAAEILLDDIALVLGSAPEAGPNLLQNGGFETGALAPWTTGGSHAGSFVTAEQAHSGLRSLHVIASGPGTSVASVRQALAGLDPAQTYTLSFYYLPLADNGLSYRLSSTFRSGEPLAITRAIRPTPGSINSTRAMLPPYPALWLNEVCPRSLGGFRDAQGKFEPWVELFNAGTAALPLGGCFLSDNYTNLAAWAFPSEAVIQPGQFLVITCDGERGETGEIHAGIRLAATNGSVVLSRSAGGAVQILDYLNYTGLALGHSYGSLPDGQPFYRRVISGPTPGLSNTNTAWPALRINEWMADNTSVIRDPADGKAQDWFELHNPTTIAVDVKGWYLADSLTNRLLFKVPDHYLIPAGGYLLVWADGEAGQNATNQPDLHVNFKLDKDGDSIALSAPDGTLIDAVDFGPQAANLSAGRDAGQAGLISVLASPTPGAENSVPPLPPALLPLVIENSVVVLTLGTVSNFTYRVEYQDWLGASNWVPLGVTLRGSGGTQMISDTLAPNRQRFYRAIRTP